MVFYYYMFGSVTFGLFFHFFLFPYFKKQFIYFKVWLTFKKIARRNKGNESGKMMEDLARQTMKVIKKEKL